ncbi:MULTISPECIES: PTS fructose transporter subunit IIB [Enterococcus]|uniref:PTS fructose transporter subunit IIBC n=1 Tax=Candidatus Enterococcus murrayae TaxID=2815321 RepID=A0ABS3HDJ3_9ENTE|nr:fructose PTS transporter subunit IIB [Enterococcus sp. MJM16]MBO0451268.1 PTS fructose transporter subunit IIBC [Enterococcus sp. MJM16]
MKVVAVTACPTGIAHTYMAQEAIEKECRKRGYEVQVETQGSMGIENELEQETIDQADVLILAVAIDVEDSERFEEKIDTGKTLSVDPGDIIKYPAKYLDAAEKL